jgi:LEA14-like dessication related protein
MLYIWGMMRFACLFFTSIVLCVLHGCSQPKELEYRNVASFRVHKADLQQATFIAELQFYNPNHYSLDLKNGNIDVYFGNRAIGKALLDERTKIPARDTFLLPVTITAGLQNIVTNALDILAEKEMLVRLQGSVKAGRGRLFVRVPVRYEGKQKIAL